MTLSVCCTQYLQLFNDGHSCRVAVAQGATPTSTVDPSSPSTPSSDSAAKAEKGPTPPYALYVEERYEEVMLRLPKGSRGRKNVMRCAGLLRAAA